MRSAAATLTLAITLTVAGLASCASPDDPVAPPGPDPSVTPVFASEEEALAAAEELYGRYLEISESIGADGWGDVSPLEEVVRSQALEDEVRNATDLHEKGWRQVGLPSFDSLTIQQIDDKGAGRVQLVVYLCLDVTSVDVVDHDGQSVVTSARPDRQPLEVGLDDSEGILKVNRSDAWSGPDFC